MLNKFFIRYFFIFTVFIFSDSLTNFKNKFSKKNLVIAGLTGLSMTTIYFIFKYYKKKSENKKIKNLEKLFVNEQNKNKILIDNLNKNYNN